MDKELHFSEEARAGLKRGVDKLTDSVAVTLGPKGRNVLIDATYGSPRATKDGVTVARSIQLEDRLENMGASLVKEVASKTNDVAGDGTTTATVLAQSIFRDGMKALASGANPIPLKRGLDRVCAVVVEKLKERSKPVEGDDIVKVASISANDPAIGELIAETMEKVGKNGVITVKESQTIGLRNEIVDGMRLDNGFISPYFVTDPDRMVCKLDNVAVVVTDEDVSNPHEYIALFEALAQSGQKTIMLVANDVTGDGLGTLVVNKLKGSVNVVAVKAPGFGDGKKEILKDLATITGGSFISKDTGKTLKEATLEDVGSAKAVTVTKDHATVVDGGGSADAIERRTKQVQTEIDDTDSDFDRERLNKRLASLSGGVGVIKIGAATETETKETVQRVEDALSATKAAVEEGIVMGGGVALAKTCDSLTDDDFGDIIDADARAAITIVETALVSPLERIAENAGKNGNVILQKVLDSEDGVGYNALTDRYEDLMKAGIVDPTKVTRSALQNAVSIASLLLTTEAAVVDIPKEEPNQPPQM